MSDQSFQSPVPPRFDDESEDAYTGRMRAALDAKSREQQGWLFEESPPDAELGEAIRNMLEAPKEPGVDTTQRGNILAVQNLATAGGHALRAASVILFLMTFAPLYPIALYLMASAAMTKMKDDAEEQAKELRKALTGGNHEKVRLLLSEGAPVEHLHDRCKPLHMAAKSGDARMIKLLLDAGANVDGNDENGVVIESPLARAMHNRHEDAVRLLLESGAAIKLDDKGRLSDPAEAWMSGTTPAILHLLLQKVASEAPGEVWDNVVHDMSILYQEKHETRGFRLKEPFLEVLGDVAQKRKLVDFMLGRNRPSHDICSPKPKI